ncbi:DNA repair protein RecN [Curvibacter sp. CHRR-16]|uniref:DNA repair protein RecN n=1 Tax=Curvibacter sp. CHRR-16 TaxID=2835872 RepID=UPI001BDA6F35|nr:DNA repair protein RecN [Curvibacter sp. CHRR-16]MBT0569583.1 DNA repair protein RecN [Curvibacter sp. CHRR-16]
MALRRIVLRDFVIVRELELDLHSGFSVLTGETGAGKSILIDALQLVTGARADVGAIREGASRTEVSAEFDCPATLSELHTWLQEAGFDDANNTENTTLLLRRTVDTQGKSRGWINGSPATAQQLRAVGEQLLDIHGQHAWQSLTRPDAVRALLDAYAQVNTRTLGQLWADWRQTQQALEQARSAQDNLQRERERLQWQIGELDKLAPSADEWPELNTQHTRLAHAQSLLDAAQHVTQALEEDDSNALSALHAAAQALQAQVHLESEFQAPLELLQSSIAQVEDVVHTLRSYSRHTELDPDRLAELDERMGLWMGLARRYKRPPEELPALWQGWKDELAELDAAADLEALEAREARSRSAFEREALQISKQRKQAGRALQAKITSAMQDLGMQGGRFEVAISPLPQPQQSGLDDVQFLVAGHAGSSPRPVGKVASGGELSRIALAIAVTTSQLGTAQTLIFDEVDSGVGGAVAETVGRLMQRLGQDRQVLAVTHLPQVAACAHHHLLVAKQQDDGHTHSSVRLVAGDERVDEIARMLGGEKRSATTVAHAREMLHGMV